MMFAYFLYCRSILVMSRGATDPYLIDFLEVPKISQKVLQSVRNHSLVIATHKQQPIATHSNPQTTTRNQDKTKHRLNVITTPLELYEKPKKKQNIA